MFIEPFVPSTAARRSGKTQDFKASTSGAEQLSRLNIGVCKLTNAKITCGCIAMIETGSQAASPNMQVLIQAALITPIHSLLSTRILLNRSGAVRSAFEQDRESLF
ncbi:hypothetical protein ACP87_06340 [Pseudomonas oleovorans]|nr:hypothetical protein [Pseudomonas oleovorans]MBN7131669.1 hypothetical protein [Pseudomonas oleovorans]MBN7141815.1 hypothetical protein [Pseudomonas oleovorans]